MDGIKVCDDWSLEDLEEMVDDLYGGKINRKKIMDDNEQSNKLLAEYYNKVFNLKPKKNGNSSNTQEGPKAAEIS